MRIRTAVLAGVLGATGVACDQEPTVREETFPLPDDLTQLVIVTRGDVAVEVGSPAQAVVEATWRGEEPDLRMVEESTDPGVVRYRAGGDCQNGLRLCDLSWRIVLPEGAALSGEVFSGDVDVDGLAGGVELVVDVGEVDLSDVSGAVDLTVDAGDVGVARFVGTRATVDVGVGDVVLLSEGVPEAIDVRSDAGDVDVTVPEARYDLDVTSGLGDVRVLGVESGGAGDPPLAARTGVGDVTVRGLPATAL